MWAARRVLEELGLEGEAVEPLSDLPLIYPDGRSAQLRQWMELKQWRASFESASSRPRSANASRASCPADHHHYHHDHPSAPEQQQQQQQQRHSTPLGQYSSRSDLEHALALQEAGTKLTDTYFPPEIIKRILNEHRPVCYLCSISRDAKSESERLCYICGLSWWPRFEELVEQAEAERAEAERLARKGTSQKEEPTAATAPRLPWVSLCGKQVQLSDEEPEEQRPPGGRTGSCGSVRPNSA